LSSYQTTLEHLYGLERGSGRLGLEGTRLLLTALGNPERRFVTLHIAGTNGKGSTACYLERLLRETGLTTGLLTSPHLVDFRERIRIDGKSASPLDITNDLELISSFPESEGRTFFEVATGIAFRRFAEGGAQAAVAEVGMGGRLDCTNVITPVVSVITPVGLDHTEVLGETLAQVAAEKAGIMKEGVPVVIAPQAGTTRRVLERAAGEYGATPVPVSERIRLRRVRPGPEGTEVLLDSQDFGRLEFQLGSLGRHQAANAATALAALGVALARPFETADGTRFALQRPAAARLEAALASARWPGRLEACRSDSRVWWDGAHNPSGVRALARAWRDGMGATPTVLVLGSSQDKEVGKYLRALEGPWTGVYTAEASTPRAYPAPLLAERAGEILGVPAEACASVGEAVERGLGALPSGGRLLITGSLYVVGDAMAALGEDPTVDLP
jgi:dihydrofolate synthase/folylpolyglutamate synthase